MGKIINFFAQSFKGADGKTSAKRVTAFVYTVLVCWVVITLLLIAYLAVFKQVEIKENTYRLMEFIGSSVLLYLLGATAMLFGVSGWTGIQALRAKNQQPNIENNVNASEANITNEAGGKNEN